MSDIKKLFLFSFFIAFTIIGNAQYEYYGDKDTDSHTFFSLSGSINTTSYTSKDELYKNTTNESGYGIDLQVTHFPDVEFSNLIIRGAIGYSQESSTSETAIIQNIPSIGVIDFSSIKMEAFFGYKTINPQSFQFYFGGGISYRLAINDQDERFTITQGDVTRPLFNPDDANIPLRYRNNGPAGIIQPFFELGGFYPIGNRFVGAHLQAGYGFMSGGNLQGFRLRRALFSVGLSYEIFR